MKKLFPTENQIVVSQVIQRELDWAQAHVDLDLTIIEQILSEEYQQRQTDGTFIGKKELLTSYRSGNRYWEVAESTNHHVQIDKNLAVVIGRWRGVGINTGERFDYRARFLSIYKLENISWRMIFDASMAD